MNNNRNNRRRGRGHRNQGSGNQLNRIDSRARGNAPQLLDKYKKLAQDAQHNGDRVQAEYYLQFADHYFRVIADNKARQEEARAKRAEERAVVGDDADGAYDEEPRPRTRSPRSKRDERAGEIASEGEAIDAHSDHSENADEKPVEKPAEKPAKPRRGRPPRRKLREDGDQADGESSIDSGVLPPSISADDAGSGGEAEAAE